MQAEAEKEYGKRYRSRTEAKARGAAWHTEAKWSPEKKAMAVAFMKEWKANRSDEKIEKDRENRQKWYYSRSP